MAQQQIQSTLATFVLPEHSSATVLGIVQQTIPHHHPQHTEACYIIQGSLAVTLEERTFMLHNGEAFLALPGMRHSYWNPTAQDTSILLIYTPGGNHPLFTELAKGQINQDPAVIDSG
jgi:quercetin dioxygenase-like cupin family protein